MVAEVSVKGLRRDGVGFLSERLGCWVSEIASLEKPNEVLWVADDECEDFQMTAVS